MYKDVKKALGKRGFKELAGIKTLYLDLHYGSWEWMSISAHSSPAEGSPWLFYLHLGCQEVEILNVEESRILNETGAVLHEVAEMSLDVLNQAAARMAEFAMTGM